MWLESTTGAERPDSPQVLATVATGPSAHDPGVTGSVALPGPPGAMVKGCSKLDAWDNKILRQAAHVGVTGRWF